MSRSLDILWWSRNGRDYSRNRIVRSAMQALGHRIIDFRPRFSALGDWEASLRRQRCPDLVWIPCFRHRDASAALRWARRRQCPVCFDPLISAWDKQVRERKKFPEDSAAAQALRRRETQLLSQCDLVVADTQHHAELFAERLEVPRDGLHVVPVGAEESLFQSTPLTPPATDAPLRILFYGSFIHLQGPELIAEAARRTPEVHWTLLGDGPLAGPCRGIAGDCSHVHFVPWVPYEQLPKYIADAHLVLGIFGSGDKSDRVIPNKVFQALAAGRPVITRRANAYPPNFPAQPHPDKSPGLTLIPAGSAESIRHAVLQWQSHTAQLSAAGKNARNLFDTHFSESTIRSAVDAALQMATRRRIPLNTPPES